MPACARHPFRLAAAALLAVWIGAAAAQDQDLPETMPAPDPKAEPAPEAATDVPLPEPRPDTGEEEEVVLPEPPAAVEATLPAAERACRARLAALGAVFEERPAESDPSGCALPHPVAVTALPGGVAVEPEALLNCPMAEAAARFVRDVVAPEAEKAFGSELAAVANGSAYVCRPRAGSGRLSEHAFGNALDFMGFRLEDGTVVTVQPTRHREQSQFLSVIRTEACGPFRTVLGPGSDEDHADHFHLDLAERRRGGTYCR